MKTYITLFTFCCLALLSLPAQQAASINEPGCCCDPPLTNGLLGECPGGEPVAILPDTIPLPSGSNVLITGDGFPLGGQYDWYDANTNLLVQSGQTATLPQGEWFLVYHTELFCADTFEFATRPVDNQIWGNLFVDQNEDGINNDPPPGFPLDNIPLELVDSNDIVVDLTLTNPGGFYTFDDFLPGIYRLRIQDLIPGHRITFPGPDSDFDPVSRESGIFLVSDFNPPIQINGGLAPQNPLVVVGNVWVDLNNNGINDVDEIPFEGFEIKVWSTNFGPGFAETDAGGNYTFPYLPQNEDYTFELVLPEGFQPGLPGGDSDFDFLGQFQLPTAPPPANPTTANAGIAPKQTVKVNPIMILSGALRNDGEMGTELNDNNLLPPNEPYSALGYPISTPFVIMLPGSIPDAVDWVTVELRDKNDSTVVIAAKAAVVKKDGSVVDPVTGKALCFDGLAHDSYFVAVRHRNHLDLMTAYPVFLDNQDFTVDFTDPNTPTVGVDDRIDLASGLEGLFPGDANGDNVLKYSGPGRDPQPILQGLPGGGADPTGQTNGIYLLEDTNLDGNLKYSGPDNDRVQTLQSIGGSDPTQTKASGLPN